MMPAGVGPAAAGPGMAAIHTRIAAIQARLDSMVPGAGSAFRLPGTQAPTAADRAAAAAANGAIDPPGPLAAGLGQAPPAAAPVAADATGAPGATATPGVTGATGVVDPSRLPDAARAWLPSIERAATQAGIDPALFTALVQHESNFRQETVSHAGAIGLAQLMPGTAEWLGVDPHDPQANLDGGARYLKEQLDRFGQVDLALAAYNAGPNRVTQAGGIPRITETQRYVERVMNTWEQLR